MLKADITIRYDELEIASSFTVPEGSGAALMGPSGSGKSSILSVVAGFYQAAQSTVSFRGQRLDGIEPAQRPLTILFQNHNLFAHLSVWNNIAIGLDPRLKLNSRQKSQIIDAMQAVGITGMQDRLPSTLSGGQQQRVALARCLVRNKPLLLLDEPFNGLDETRQQALRELIKTLMHEKNLTLLLATHQTQDAKQLCEQVIEVQATTGTY